MTQKRNYMVIIVGPTGVGKTELAEGIAEQMPAELVNMDMGQFYTPLTIGTAKPDWQLSPIKQHLFDVVSDPRNITVVEYRQMLLATLEDIWSRGKLPILVGGSSFYLKSIFYPPAVDDNTIVARDYGETKDLWQGLHEIDPERAAVINKNDVYRIKRALDIWHATGKKPSEYEQQFMLPADFLLIFLTRDRQELYDRIDKRVELMMKEGWLDEVAALKGTAWESFLKEKKIIGYPELLDYLDELQNEERLKGVIAQIARRTRNYAKRQYTFWRKLQKQLEGAVQKADKPEEQRSQIISLNLTGADLTLYIKQLSQQLIAT